MSLVVYTLRAIRCDAPGCLAEFDLGPGTLAATLRNVALTEGWSFRKGDHCPEHRA